jgi:hypothetical protein
MDNVTVETLCGVQDLSPAIQLELLNVIGPDQMVFLAERDDLDPAVAIELWARGNADTRGTLLVCTGLDDAEIAASLRDDGRLPLINQLLNYTQEASTSYGPATLAAMVELTLAKRSTNTATRLLNSGLGLSSTQACDLVAQVLTGAQDLDDLVFPSREVNSSPNVARALLEVVAPHDLSLMAITALLSTTAPLSLPAQRRVCNYLCAKRNTDYGLDQAIAALGCASWVDQSIVTQLAKSQPDVPVGNSSQMEQSLAKLIGHFEGLIDQLQSAPIGFPEAQALEESAKKCITPIFGYVNELSMTPQRHAQLKAHLAQYAAHRPKAHEVLAELVYDLDPAQVAVIAPLVQDIEVLWLLISDSPDNVPIILAHPQAPALLTYMVESNHYTTNVFDRICASSALTPELLSTLPLSVITWSEAGFSKAVALAATHFATNPPGLMVFTDLIEREVGMSLADALIVADRTTDPPAPTRA